MGYLHARGIIHKGLNTKNIFIEKTTDNRDKVVITDMGLSALSSCLWSRLVSQSVSHLHAYNHTPGRGGAFLFNLFVL